MKESKLHRYKMKDEEDKLRIFLNFSLFSPGPILTITDWIQFGYNFYQNIIMKKYRIFYKINCWIQIASYEHKQNIDK